MLIQLFEHSQSHGYPKGLKRKMLKSWHFFLWRAWKDGFRFKYYCWYL